MHYADGQEAKLGDLVRGKPYNTPHEVVGAVVGLVPGVDSCNVRVAFVKTIPVDQKGAVHPAPSASLLGYGAVKIQWGAVGSETEPRIDVHPCVDYGETKAFSLLARGA